MSEIGVAPTGNAGRGQAIDRAILVLASVIVLGSIMSILDTTIVNVAIDTLGRDFHTGLSTIQWVATGYLLALSIVIPLTGWAMGRFGAKPIWMLSVALFLVGSALCGAAWSVGSLIAFRALQGIGGGMLLPVGQAILAQAAGPKRMGRVMSIIGVPMLLGPVFGPVIGGLLVEYTSWRWIFYVNLPIGILALALAARLLPRVAPDRSERLDLRGLVLLSPGLALIVYGFSEASSSGGFGSTQTLIGLIAGGALVILFVSHALGRGRRALLDVRLFRDRSFSAAAATSFLVGLAMFGAMILLPLYYQVVRGSSVLTAGLLLAPQGIGAAMAMPLAGTLTDKLGAGRVVPVGLALALLGTAAYAEIGSHTAYWWLSLALVVRGFGLGATLMPAMAAGYATLEHDDVPRATTTLNIIQRVGGSIGTALLAVYLSRELATAVPAGGHGASLSTLGEIPPHTREQIAGPLAGAFGHTFWLALALTALAYLPALFLPRQGSAPEPPTTAPVAARAARGAGPPHAA